MPVDVHLASLQNARSRLEALDEPLIKVGVKGHLLAPQRSSTTGQFRHLEVRESRLRLRCRLCRFLTKQRRWWVIIDAKGRHCSWLMKDCFLCYKITEKIQTERSCAAQTARATPLSHVPSLLPRWQPTSSPPAPPPREQALPPATLLRRARSGRHPAVRVLLPTCACASSADAFPASSRTTAAAVPPLSAPTIAAAEQPPKHLFPSLGFQGLLVFNRLQRCPHLRRGGQDALPRAGGASGGRSGPAQLGGTHHPVARRQLRRLDQRLPRLLVLPQPQVRQALAVPGLRAAAVQRDGRLTLVQRVVVGAGFEVRSRQVDVDRRCGKRTKTARSGPSAAAGGAARRAGGVAAGPSGLTLQV